MRALVTGGTGIVGNAIVRRLMDAQHDVRVLVRPTSDRSALPGGLAMSVGDLTEPSSLPEAVEGCDVVFHAAGLPEQWRRDPADFDRVNRQGTVNLLRAAAETGVKRVVHTSTLDVFRKARDGPLRETEPDPDPKPTAYERSKVAAEREADRFVEQGLDVVFVNPGSVYGPAPTTTGMTQLFVRIANRDAPMLPPGGMSVVYAESLADAHIAAAEVGETGRRYLVTDRYVTVRRLAEMIADEIGMDRLPPNAPAWVLKAVANVSAPLARRFGFTPLVTPGELHFLLWEARVDNSRAREELGYEPFPITEGVRRTIAHLRDRELI